MRYYIGIDDTDNLESRGTGFHARSLGLSLMKAGLFELKSITRHQLLADRRIPFTSHNSSACLFGESDADVNIIASHCRDFLLEVSTFDSDAGLCIANPDYLSNQIIEFGNRAKSEVLTLEEACELAADHGIYLEGFLNTRLGMIGSLSAVGLRYEGNDGRLLWTPNLRELEGIHYLTEIKELTGIERIVDMNDTDLPNDTKIKIGEWCRPVMRKGFITLVTEKSDNLHNEYRPASKEHIKSISE